MTGWKLKKFSLAGLFLLAAILLVACNRPFDDEIGYVIAHGPTSLEPYVATGPSCTELEEIAQETLANVRPPPATARFSAADRKALAITAFGHLCELSREVGWRQSATAEESKAAEFLMDRFTEFGYSPEMQDFQVRIGSLQRNSSNIILELPGHGEGIVILGAHYDTVRNSVGANDNASRGRRVAGAGREIGATALVEPDGIGFSVHPAVYRLWFRGNRNERQWPLRAPVDRRRVKRHQGHDQPGFGGVRHNFSGGRATTG